MAKATDQAASDIDLMIISDSITYGDVFGALERVTRNVAQEINPTVYTSAKRLSGFPDGQMLNAGELFVGQHKGLSSEPLLGISHTARAHAVVPSRSCERSKNV